MVGPTAQLVAICCHFNGRAHGIHAGPLYPANSTCLFCESIRFLRHETPPGGSACWNEVATGPDEWLSQEAAPGRAALLLHGRGEERGISDRMSAGFVGGGGRWHLAVVSADGTSLWEAAWEVGNRNAAEGRIWRVCYRRSAENATFPLPEARSPESVGIQLREALVGIVAFADDHGVEGFASCFRRAIKCLASDDPFAEVYHKDLAPPGLLDLPSQRLLAACQAAWVFGGMGSWNDMGFDGEEQQRYDRLSDGLFALVNEGICAAANSSAGERARPGDAADAP